MRCRSWTIGCLLVSLVGIGACSSSEKIVERALNAPTGSKPEALMAMNQGNQDFAVGKWAEAQAQYEKALTVEPQLGEAHYNLALTLDRLGDRAAADEHYTQAANLRPGHPVIWNSRKYRRYGDVTVQKNVGTSIPALPGLGGIGGGQTGNPPGGY